uniref:Beta-1,4-galactosyltransferase n=1 Tax=Arion vulgaris TaxID=1028688 RepID=A0A0B7A0X0_9EUPU
MLKFPSCFRALQPCDQLLILILFGNVFYIAYYMNTSVSTSNTVGDLACDCDPVSPEYLISTHPQMELGGRLRPNDCRALERTAIIIPFRDRFDHLYTLLKMILPLLVRQQLDVTFFVIEQTEPILFNRAALHNIGYLEALKVDNFDCFIFHDVDLIPLNDHNLYRCHDYPQHFASTIKFGMFIPVTQMSDTYVGGVIAFKRHQYEFINGNSNLYFGWGGEDEDLYQRIVNKNLAIVRAKKTVTRYHMLLHERHEVTQDNLKRRWEILKTATQRQGVEGLSTTKYMMIENTQHRLYTRIKVSLNMVEVFKTAPVSTLRDLRRAMLEKRAQT